MIPRFLTNLGVRAVKKDLLDFIDQHEERFTELVYMELEKLDQRTPDEETFIDIKMAPLGAKIAEAILEATRTFLREY